MSGTSKFWVVAAIVGAVAVGAAVTNRHSVDIAPAVPIAAAESAPPVVTKAALPMPKPHTTEPAAPPLVMTAELETLVKPLLQPGTDLTMASEGFPSRESFLATAYAAKNLNVPFVLLKDRIVAERQPLAMAIAAIRPEVDAKAEAARAISAAHALAR